MIEATKLEIIVWIDATNQILNRIKYLI
jgi:hypothetical protein